MFDEYFVFIFNVTRWITTGTEITINLERFGGYNVFALPWIMPAMIVWFFIYYFLRLLLELATALFLWGYN